MSKVYGCVSQHDASPIPLTAPEAIQSLRLLTVWFSKVNQGALVLAKPIARLSPSSNMMVWYPTIDAGWLAVSQFVLEQDNPRDGPIAPRFLYA
jgi:hypothetical protein